MATRIGPSKMISHVTVLMSNVPFFTLSVLGLRYISTALLQLCGWYLRLGIISRGGNYLWTNWNDIGSVMFCFSKTFAYFCLLEICSVTQV